MYLHIFCNYVKPCRGGSNFMLEGHLQTQGAEQPKFVYFTSILREVRSFF